MNEWMNEWMNTAFVYLPFKPFKCALDSLCTHKDTGASDIYQCRRCVIWPGDRLRESHQKGEGIIRYRHDICLALSSNRQSGSLMNPMYITDTRMYYDANFRSFQNPGRELNPSPVEWQSYVLPPTLSYHCEMYMKSNNKHVVSWTYNNFKPRYISFSFSIPYNHRF